MPDLTGWLTDRSTMLPVLVVLIDREGADFELYDPWPHQPVARDTADGDTEHLTKVAAGGWSHKRYQRRAEQTWRRNAEQVAAEVGRLVQTGVRLVAIAGDVRAQAELRHALGEPGQAVLVELDTGGRAAGSSRETLNHAVDEAVRNLVVTDHLRVIHELDQEAGRHGAAVRGISNVLPKLVHGQVRTIMIAPAVASSHEINPTEHPGIPLPSSAFTGGQVRADLAVLCAAAATDAEALIAPRSVADDGVAGVLRW